MHIKSQIHIDTKKKMNIRKNKDGEKKNTDKMWFKVGGNLHKLVQWEVCTHCSFQLTVCKLSVHSCTTSTETCGTCAQLSSFALLKVIIMTISWSQKRESTLLKIIRTVLNIGVTVDHSCVSIKKQ